MTTWKPQPDGPGVYWFEVEDGYGCRTKDGPIAVTVIEWEKYLIAYQAGDASPSPPGEYKGLWHGPLVAPELPGGKGE